MLELLWPKGKGGLVQLAHAHAQRLGWLIFAQKSKKLKWNFIILIYCV
jgi:hypothetical protein